MEPGEERKAPDLRHFLRILRRRRWAFLACLIALPAIAYAVSKTSPNTYQASVLMQVQGGSSDQQLSGQQQAPSASVVDIDARLIQTTAVARVAAQSLTPRPADPSSLLGHISVSPDESTGFLTLTAHARTGPQAADIANAFASGVVQNEQAGAVRQLGSAIVQLRAQTLATSDPTIRKQLAGQLARLRALRAVQASDISVIQNAGVPGSPVSPRPRRDAVLGAIIGLLLGLAVVALLELLDSKVRNYDELEELVGAPLLAVVPKGAFGASADSGVVREAFQTLRASLTYFNVDSDVTSVVITSAVKEEGKTTVAVNLALAAARSGRDVVLIDADLRRPRVAERLGARARPGLVDVLVGRSSLFDALVTVEEEGGRLRVLPAGSVPPNPSELVASAQMQALLAQVSAVGDLVVIDSPPVLAVSDAIPLLNQTSGVIVVSRLHTVRREPLRRLRQILSTAQIPILGVVATGASQDGIYGYGEYPAEYGDPPTETEGATELDAATVNDHPGHMAPANGDANGAQHPGVEHDVTTYR